jgi:hypothetical protein
MKTGIKIDYIPQPTPAMILPIMNIFILAIVSKILPKIINMSSSMIFCLMLLAATK